MQSYKYIYMNRPTGGFEHCSNSHPLTSRLAPQQHVCTWKPLGNPKNLDIPTIYSYIENSTYEHNYTFIRCL